MRHFFILPLVRMLLSLTIMMLSPGMLLSSFEAGLIAFSSFFLFFMTRLPGTVIRAIDMAMIAVTTDNDLMMAAHTIVNTT